MTTLTPDQARQLAAAFHDLALGVGSYRFAKWDNLTDDQRQKLENLQWTLLNYSSDFATVAIAATLAELPPILANIKNATTQATAAVKTIATIDKVVRVASSLAVLGGAIVSGNPSAIGDAAQSVIGAATS